MNPGTNDETKPIDDCPDGVCPTPVDECPGGDCPTDPVDTCPGGGCCDQFDAKIPFDCLLKLIALFRSGDIANNKMLALQLAAWIIGCSAKSAATVVINALTLKASDCEDDGTCKTPADIATDFAQSLQEYRNEAISLSEDQIVCRLEDIAAASLNDGPNLSSVNAVKAGFLTPELIALILQLIQLISKR